MANNIMGPKIIKNENDDSVPENGIDIVEFEIVKVESGNPIVIKQNNEYTVIIETSRWIFFEVSSWSDFNDSFE